MVSSEYKDNIKMIVLENYVLMCEDKDYNSPKRMRQSRVWRENRRMLSFCEKFEKFLAKM